MSWDATQPASTTKIKNSPPVLLANWDAIEDWSDTQHYGLNHALSGAHRPGQCSVIMVDTTANISALTNVACGLAYDITLNVLKYNTGLAWSNIGGTVPSGTKMVFYQAAAPTGWTLLASVDDKLIYITKGSVLLGETGGTPCSSGSWSISGFSGATASHTLTLAETPAHAHTYTGAGDLTVGGSEYSSDYSAVAGGNSLSTGGGGGHTHDLSMTDVLDHTWRPAAYNCIICTKD